MIQKNDALEHATRSLEKPEMLLGETFTKKFGPTQHSGTITDYDTDVATGDVIWRVNFEDGDRGDYNLQELTIGLGLG